MRYWGQFASRNGHIYKVELNVSRTATDVELELGVPPFTASWEGGDTLFKPMKCSGATIKMIVDDYIGDFMVSSPRAVTVTLTDSTSSTVKWRGYLQPNVYSQPYDGGAMEMEIEAIDQLAALQFVAYKPQTVGIKTAFTIINDILSANTQYSYLYVTKNIYLTANTSLMKDIYINEGAFMDKDATCKDVLEAICEYLGVTMYADGQNVVIMDYDSMAGPYYRNVIGGTSVTTVSKGTTVDMGDLFAETGTQISAKEIYKSVKLPSKFYGWKDLTDVIFDTNKLENRGGSQDARNIVKFNVSTKQYTVLQTMPTSLADGEYVVRTKVFSHPNVTTYVDGVEDDSIDDLSELKTVESAGLLIAQEQGRDKTLLGSYLGEENYVLLAANTKYGAENYQPMIKMTYDRPKNIGNVGAFDLSGKVALLRSVDYNYFVENTENIGKTGYHGGAYDEKWVADGPYVGSDARGCIPYTLKIGGYYWNDSTKAWQTTHVKSFIRPMRKSGQLIFNTWNEIPNTETPEWKSAGATIPLENLPIVAGEIELTLYTPKTRIQNNENIYSYNVLISGLTMKFVDVAASDTDVEYYTEIDANNVNGYEAKATLCTYARKTPSDNTPLKMGFSIYDWLQQLTKTSEGSTSAPEELRCAAIVKQYSTNTLCIEASLANTIEMCDAVEWDVMSGKTFVVGDMNVDYYDAKATYNLIEKK